MVRLVQLFLGIACRTKSDMKNQTEADISCSCEMAQLIAGNIFNLVFYTVTCGPVMFAQCDRDGMSFCTGRVQSYKGG